MIIGKILEQKSERIYTKSLLKAPVGTMSIQNSSFRSDSFGFIYKFVAEDHHQISSNTNIAGNKCLILEFMNKGIVPIEKSNDID